MPTDGSSAGGSGDSLSSTILTFASASSLVATTLSVYSIVLQLKNYRKPLLQRWVVRIILMVPIFSLASLIALYSLDAAFLIDLIRDLYEAFSIYCFFSLLLTYLGGERSLLILLHGREPTPHPWPVCLFLSPLDISDPFSFLFLKRGILQYVQVKPILAVITIILKATGSYGEGQLQADAGYTYVSTVYNISVTLSLYCLAMFWVCTNHDLKPFRPMPKFICVKALIFFTFWQGLGVSVLVRTGLVKSALPSENFSIAIQDAMLCFEMPIFAMLHMYAFSHKDYLPSRDRTYSGRLPFMYALKDSLLGFKDVLDDSLTTFRGTGFSYRTFEPAEGGLHSATGDARAKRARAGLRYANGGKSKYWLPMPGADAEEAYGRRASKVAFAPLPAGYTATDAADRLIEIIGHPSDITSSGTGFAELLTSPVRTIGRKIREKRDEARGYAPIAPEQAEEVVHNDPRFYSAAQSSNLAFMRNTAAGAVPFAGFAASSRSSIISGSNQEHKLEFEDISSDDDADYDEARLLEHGDYNYPVVDASQEEARRSMREMEDAFVNGRATHWRVRKAADQRKWEADASLKGRASAGPALQQTETSQKQPLMSVDKGKGKALPTGCIDILIEDKDAGEALDQQERAKMEPAFRNGIPRKAFKRTYGAMSQQAGSSQAYTSRSAPHGVGGTLRSGKLPPAQQRTVSRGSSSSAIEAADAGARYSQLNGVKMPYPAGEFEDKEYEDYAKAVAPPKHAVLTHLDDGRPFDADEEHANQRRAQRQRAVSGEEQFNPWM